MYLSWESDAEYCSLLPFHSDDTILLDILDTCVFDFLIGNADRHHYETLGTADDAVLLMLDNGKRYVNEMQLIC